MMPGGQDALGPKARAGFYPHETSKKESRKKPNVSRIDAEESMAVGDVLFCAQRSQYFNTFYDDFTS